MLNIALLGAGRIGQIHGRNVQRQADARLSAIYDPQTAAASRLAVELSTESVPLDEVFEREEIDAVMICSSTDTHADYIERAISSGKHVFCEKPVDLSLSRVRRCMDKVAHSDRQIMVAFNRRFDPSFMALQQQIASGHIGEVELVSIISKDPAPPPIGYIKTSGGLFKDMTIHDFDMARFLLGEAVQEVSAYATCLVDKDIEAVGDFDTAVIQMKTHSGKLVQISNSRRASFGYDQRIEVHGSEGMLSAGNMHENTVTKHAQTGLTQAKPLHFFLERYATAYQNEIERFVSRIHHQQGDVPGLEDGLQALVLAEAALVSVTEARPVSISEIAQIR